MGAPSTGAESLQCCGRDGGHQVQHVPEANNNRPVDGLQQEDHRNNNELLNNNHIYLNPYFESFYTFIDETQTTLPITEATSTPLTNRSIPSTAAAADLSIARDINSNGPLEALRCTRAKDRIRLLKEKFVKGKKHHEKPTNLSPGDLCAKTNKQSVKVKRKDAVPARMRGASGRGGDSDPLMHRPRRRIADKTPKKQKYSKKK